MAVRALPRSRRRLLIAIAAVIVLAFIALNVLSTFYVDLLWFREVHFSSVFWTVLRTKVLLGVVFGLLFFLLLLSNLLIVRRITPRYRVFSPEQEIIERYRLALEPYMKWILPGLSLLIALFVGIAASGRWQVFQLWRHSSGVSFGSSDPIFHKDASYYVFRLPFLQFVQGWLFSSLVGVTVVAAIVHYLFGGIRVQAVGERVTPQVKVHLSVLLGLIMLTKAWGYWLGRYTLLTSNRGVVTGASYTDIHVQKPALFFLMVVAIICAVLFLVNIRLRGWILPVLGLGLLVVVAIITAIVAAAFQKFSVGPQELQRERPYIEYNIAGTRRAFGLDPSHIKPEQRPVTSGTSQADVATNQNTIQNIRLWDPTLLLANFDNLQRIRQYYLFNDVDVDRYPIDGTERMVMISAREVSQNNIPNGKTWQNAHLVYTHGFGAVANQVNTATAQGQPDFILQDIPPAGQIPLAKDGARVYFGERQDVPFVVVRSGQRELDYQGTPTNDQRNVYYNYTADGGIRMGGFFGRLLFAWRYKDINLLISSLIHGDSRIMIYRNIRQRIPKPAPFLHYDGDPYAAIVDGHLVWIQDAYTTTDAYPYSEQLSVGSITNGHLVGQINYIRNSVKVVVDAFTGQMTYYVVDPTDPIIRVWERVFPSLFTTGQAPLSLRQHFRYPEDLFTIQANQYAKYHISNPVSFYQRQDFWQIPTDPAVEQNLQETVPLRPYYVVMRLPGSASEEFVLIQPFTPVGRPNMVAWMAAKSDPADYGQIVSFEFPSGVNVDGPTQVVNQINSDPTFASQQTLLSKGNSRVLYGNFLVIPIGDSFLYVQPIFVQSAQQAAFPELKRVVVVQNRSVGVGTTLPEALAGSLGKAPAAPPPTPPPTGGGGKLSQRVGRLISQALQHFGAANHALKSGDLGTYQSEVQQAEALIKQANQLAAGGSAASRPSPTPTPSSSPSG